MLVQFRNSASIEDFLGQTFTSVSATTDELLFLREDGTGFLMYHSQDCCEEVTIDDIIGDVQDLVGSPIVMAEEVIGADEDSKVDPYGYQDGSYTWTFYKLGTAKGSVTIRWYGASNGYYSESVDISQVTEGKKRETH